MAAAVLGLSPLKADATRVEYYATVGEPLCELSYTKSGLGYCDVIVGVGEEVPRGELINVSNFLIIQSRETGCFRRVCNVNVLTKAKINDCLS